MATITDMGELRGKIFYRKNYQTRVVSFVEWLDKKQRLRSVDHYTKEGFKYAETVYDLTGYAIFKKYMTRENKEVKYENYVTRDVVVNYNGKSYFFDSKTEFIKFYLNEININLEQVIFNNLSTPFLSLYDLPQLQKGILFWQERTQNDVPGNMKLILDENRHNQFAIIIPNQKEYRDINRQLTAEEQQSVYPSGYVYHKVKENHFSKNILILTNSDQIPHLETLINDNEEFQFYIGAKTEMSSKLLDMAQYKNVKLYPIIKEDVVEMLYQHCDIYLDINEGNEIFNAVRTAFNHNMLILGYKDIVYNSVVTANHNQCSVQDADYLNRMLKDIVRSQYYFKEKLNDQLRHANEVSISLFKKGLEKALQS